MRILITGGAGFIGSHVADELLSRGHEVAALDDLSTGARENLNDRASLHVGDIRDAAFVNDTFQTFRPERVCHLAAQMSVSRSMREPAFDADVNIVGLLRILEACREHSVDRVVFASSGGALYGDVTEPVDESHPCAPGAPYGISKWVGEQYLRFFAEKFGVQSAAMRYTNVYGPRQNPLGEAGVVAIFSTLMLDGRPVTINGDGKYVRDYVYVADVARANATALEAELPASFCAFNVGTGIGVDVNQLAAAMQPVCEAVRQSAGKSDPIPELVSAVAIETAGFGDADDAARAIVGMTSELHNQVNRRSHLFFGDF
eukprot:g12568.t1